MRSKNERRHHAFEIDDEQRRETVAGYGDRERAAERRFRELTAPLMRKMPADHAALKATVRELRQCLFEVHYYGNLCSQAWALENIGGGRHGLRLRELLHLVKTIDYRYDYTRKRDRRYIDLAIAFVGNLIESAIFTLRNLLLADVLRIRGDVECQEVQE